MLMGKHPLRIYEGGVFLLVKGVFMNNNRLILWTWILVSGLSLAIWLPRLEVPLFAYGLLALAGGILWFLKLPGLRLIRLIMLLCISFGYYQWFDQRNVSDIQWENANDEPVEVTGRITSSIVVDGDHVGFTLLTSQVRFNKDVQTVKESVQVSIR
jgi:competence protein ComEC